MLMLRKGDAVFHPSHGAGVLRSTKTRKEVSGVKRQYYRIELVDGSGSLLIPSDHVEEVGLLPIPDDTHPIVAVLSGQPQELPADYRKRKPALIARIHSGDIKQVAEALRDLAWRERETNLSDGDSRLKAEAQDLLAGVLALQFNTSPSAACQRLHEIISQAFESHKASRTSKDAEAAEQPARGRWAKIHPLFGTSSL